MLFNKTYTCLCATILLLCAQDAKTQDSGSLETSSSLIQIPRSAIEKLANVTNEEDLWILLPSNFSDSQLGNLDFSLFKLNTAQLAEHRGTDPSNESAGWIGAESDTSSSQPTKDGQAAPIFRGARKMNLFGNVLNKPKVSPLYLVNGTVCRFVNAQPICTTLSTTGLFRGQVPIQTNGNGLSGLFQQQQPQQGNNFNPQQRQVSPNQQGFNNQQGNFQQFRPAALLEGENQDLNVEMAANGSARDATLNRLKPTRQQVLNVVQATRPLNYVANRRPLNLLTFSRPFRNSNQRRGKDATSSL